MFQAFLRILYSRKRLTSARCEATKKMSTPEGIRTHSEPLCFDGFLAVLCAFCAPGRLPSIPSKFDNATVHPFRSR
ncbi:hypothetical protein Poly24_08450 [Rosistilla carotiformis]|uniref:Uncharacterized protein n=1 Tax=Rosistilla carotiformis TaxID=2528017 RepID=A0A518JNM9_9BACT|nr:hypothetical protein Poly24_08450 [Rosistilla carotiformis]